MKKIIGLILSLFILPIWFIVWNLLPEKSIRTVWENLLLLFIDFFNL